MKRFPWTILVTLGATFLVAGCSDDGGDNGDDTPCTADADCETGFRCNTDTGQCESKGPMPEILGVTADDKAVAPGLQADAAVVIGANGVPSIYAASDRDSTYMSGWIQAQERLPMMHIMRLQARGNLTSMVGGLMDPNDVVDYADIEARMMNLTTDGRDVAEVMYEQASPEAKELLDAFTAGINDRVDAYAADDSQWFWEFSSALIGITPQNFPRWTPADSIAFGNLQAWDLANSLGDELTRTEYAMNLPPELYDELIFSQQLTGTTMIQPPPGQRVGGKAPGFRPVRSVKGLKKAREWFDRAEEMRHEIGYHPGHGASNNWIMNPGDGKVFLCNDPHLHLFAPPIWIPMLMDSKELGDAATGHTERGFVFPGLPAVILGTNGDVAIGATNTSYDVTDIWEEEVTFEGDVPKSVLFDGAQVDLLAVEMEFALGLGDGASVLTRTVYVVPHHGPIIPSSLDPVEGTALSWAWTGQVPNRTIEALTKFKGMKNLDDVWSTYHDWDIGAQNWVFADRSGETGFYPHAHVPVRGPGDLSEHPPWLIMPGTGGYEWIDRVADEDLPQARNPDRGYLITANEDLNGTLADNDPLNDGPYLYLVNSLDMRAYRLEQLLTDLYEGGNVTAESFKAIQTDQHYTLAELVLSWALPLLGDAGKGRLTADAAWAVEQLEGWDYGTPSGLDGYDNAESGIDAATQASAVGATLFSGFYRQLMWHLMGDEMEAHGFNGYPFWSHRHYALLFALRRAAEESDISMLWDDVATDGTTETPEDILVAAFDGTMTYLGGLAEFQGVDRNEWVWGRVHTTKPDSPYPDQLGSLFHAPRYAWGGALDTVSPAGFGQGFGGEGGDFNFGASASFRAIYEVSADGIEMQYALPGGVSERTYSDHFQDLMVETWLPQQYKPFPGTLEEVLAAKVEVIAYQAE